MIHMQTANNILEIKQIWKKIMIKYFFFFKKDIRDEKQNPKNLLIKKHSDEIGKMMTSEYKYMYSITLFNFKSSSAIDIPQKKVQSVLASVLYGLF